MKPTRVLDSEDSMTAYLQSIGQQRLLSRAQEQALGRRIQSGDNAAFREMVEANLPLVVSIATKYQSPHYPLCDAIQDGNLGLLTAVRKYDPELGYKFSTYATWWIKQGIRRHIGAQTRLIRLPSHAELQAGQLFRAMESCRTTEALSAATGISIRAITWIQRAIVEPVRLSQAVGEDGNSELAALLPASDDPNLQDAAEATELQQRIEDALLALPERQRQAAILRWGLGRDGYEHTLDETGRIMGICRERVRQLEKQARNRIRPVLEPWR